MSYFSDKRMFWFLNSLSIRMFIVWKTDYFLTINLLFFWTINKIKIELNYKIFESKYEWKQ
jgi:hypothetical protein